MTELHTDGEQAVIFDVQNFSINDGPGIRTVVFFKGCPLKCKWCHNPESNIKKPQLVFKSRLCVGCMKCVQVCPENVHRIVEKNGNRIHVVENDLCKACGECLKTCCYDALSISGERYTPRQLVERIKGDFHYFDIKDKNGNTGGITFSGGEPLLYVDFIARLRELLPQIHFAVETSGYSNPDVFARLCSSVDLFLFDYKVSDPVKHKNLCGVDNSPILNNLAYLNKINKPAILRLPMIQGINDCDEHFVSIARILNNNENILHAEIMPYHTYGIQKAYELGIKTDPSMPNQSADDVTVNRWISKFEEIGCKKVIRS